MKTREIRQHISAQGFERGVVFVLEAMNEQLQQCHKNTVELAKLIDRMSNVMSNYDAGAGAMKRSLEQIQRGQKHEAELGPNTNSLDKET